MKYSDEINKIVANKKFKTFWHCLDFLTLAGYPLMEAFGISLKEFGEDKIFENVAFIKVIRIKGVIHSIEEIRQAPFGKYLVTIGIIDETNHHLAGIYKTYRDWLIEDTDMVYNDIEDTCEIISIGRLNGFLLDFLLHASKSQYGYEAFKYEKEVITDRARLQSLSPEINALHQLSGPEYTQYLRTRQNPNNHEPFR